MSHKERERLLVPYATLLSHVSSVLSVEIFQTLNANYHTQAPYVTRQPPKSSSPMAKSTNSVTDVSCVEQLSSVQPVTNVHTVALHLPEGGLGLAQGHKNPQAKLHPPFLDQTNSDQIYTYHKWICTSPQEQPPDGSITCPCAETSNMPDFHHAQEYNLQKHD